MNSDVDGMFALAIIAMEINFVCRHVPCFIITALNCNNINVKFAANSKSQGTLVQISRHEEHEHGLYSRKGAKAG